MDVRNPDLPEWVGSYAGSWPAGESIDAINGHVWVGGWLPAFEILDVTDPANIYLASTCGGPGLVYDFEVAGDYLYAVDWAAGLWILDKSDPEKLRVAGKFAAHYATAVGVSENHAYIAGAGDLRAIDVSDPANPVGEGIATFTGDAQDILISGDILYLASATDQGGLWIYDISDPSSPVAVAYHLVDEALSVSVGGNYIYLATRGGLLVFDSADLTGPITRLDDIWSRAVVAGNRLYGIGSRTSGSDYELGFYIFDVSEPAEPVELGFVAVPGLPTGLAVSGSCVYVNCESLGTLYGTQIHRASVLSMFQYPAQPQQMGVYGAARRSGWSLGRSPWMPGTSTPGDLRVCSSSNMATAWVGSSRRARRAGLRGEPVRRRGGYDYHWLGRVVWHGEPGRRKLCRST